MIIKLFFISFIIISLSARFIMPSDQELTKLILTQIRNQFSRSLGFESLSLIQPTCTLCHTLVKVAKYVPLPKDLIYTVLKSVGTTVCTLDKIQIKEVCKGAVGQMTDYILKSVWDHYTDPHIICHQIRMCTKEFQILNYNDYARQILINKPNKTQQLPTKRRILKMLHMSDLHPDIFYTEGTPTICDQPLCCRSDVKALNNSKKAGFWGSLAECDIPLQTFNVFLQNIKNQQIDLVVWTGDNTAHDIWKQSQAYNTNFTMILSNLIKAKLKCPILPAKGNHESYPVNVYEWGKQQQLNYGLASAWSDFIGQQATDMLRKQGYFKIVLEKYNLKVLSINTEAGNNLNWVLLKQPTDPGNQLEWIRSQLQKSEKINQFVYIIGHIPPNQMLNQWGNRFNALVDRYNYIIRGQYYGHTHDDHMAFFTAINDTTNKIINHYMVAPSLTTATHKNPRYRILQIDQDTMRVVNYHQYALRLEKQISRDTIPKFELEYSFLQEYKFKQFSFQTLQKFRESLKNDVQFQKKYTFYQYGGIKEGSSGPQIECSTRTTLSLVSQCLGTPYKNSIFQRVAGPWKKLIHKN